MKKPVTLKSFIIATLRLASYRWEGRTNAIKNARVSRGQYKCAICLELFKNGQYIVDHIHPVVSVEKGFTTWDSYIQNMFCDESGFQILCKPCSNAKTAVEVETRKYYRKERKKIDNDEEL